MLLCIRKKEKGKKMFKVMFECVITGESIIEICYDEVYALNYADVLRKDKRVKNVKVIPCWD